MVKYSVFKRFSNGDRAGITSSHEVDQMMWTMFRRHQRSEKGAENEGGREKERQTDRQTED